MFPMRQGPHLHSTYAIALSQRISISAKKNIADISYANKQFGQVVSTTCDLLFTIRSGRQLLKNCRIHCLEKNLKAYKAQN